MIRRFFCVLCAFLLLSVSAFAAEEPEAFSYDFDLTFSLDPGAFRPVARERAEGYAQMLGRLRLKGNVILSPVNDSIELNASLFYKDKPEVSVPFRVYGLSTMLYFTSPAINNEILLFNMPAFMEFAVKTRNNMDVPLPYLAFLYPVTTEFAMSGLANPWYESVGKFTQSGEVTPEQLQEVSESWDWNLQEDEYLLLWIDALANGSESPEAVQAEFANLPFYPAEYVSGGKPLTVEIGQGTETWKNAAGTTLYTSQETENGMSCAFTLPATENRYEPRLFFSRETGANGLSLNLQASYKRPHKDPDPGTDEEPSEEEPAEEEPAEEEPASPTPAPADESPAEPAVSDVPGETPAVPENAGPKSGEGGGSFSDMIEEEEEEEEYNEEGAGEEGEGYQSEADAYPDNLLELSVSAEGIPVSLPSDSSFSLTAVLKGALFPNVALTLLGETKKDGALSLTLCKPGSGETGPVPVLTVQGTVTPTEPSMVPSYRHKVFHGAYNLFSINEEKLVRLKQDVAPGLLGAALNFIAEAPTAFCQSLMDDLTDLDVLGMFLDQ